MSREPIPTWFFVLVAVRHNDKYLLVHEAKHGQLWYFPAGRVEPGEDFIAAAKRETLEEAGTPIEVTGIVRIEHSPIPQGTRIRLIVTASPIDDSPPKSIADEESLEAGWFTFRNSIIWLYAATTFSRCLTISNRAEKSLRSLFFLAKVNRFAEFSSQTASSRPGGGYADSVRTSQLHS